MADSITASVLNTLESSCELVLPSIAGVLVAVFVVWVLYLRKQVAKRIATEKALNDQLEFFDTLSEATPQPIYVRDIAGKFISGTRSYLEAVGAKAEDLYGKTVLQGPPKFGAAEAMHQAYMHAIANNQAMRMRRATIMNGEERWIDHWIQPFHDANGVMQGVICGWLDVTEQQRLITELEQVVTELEVARKQAEQANREKTSFLATMSHEIRTPLSAVIGTLELVQHQADQGVLDKKGIQIAYSCANGLQDLIGDVLDISRIESGRLVFTPERVNLKSLIESVASSFEGLAREKGLALLLELAACASKDVLVDPVRVRQMLFNLVSNAIKFTVTGHVKIKAVGQHVGAGVMRLQLTVSDTGIGVSESEQKRLFLPFTQLNKSSDPSGSGLGLAITRSLCELMGGTLTMSSSLNAGTSMLITLEVPVWQGKSTVSQKNEQGTVLSHAPAPSLHVLVVDDYAIHRQLLCQQLEFLGHTFAEATTGQQALELWRTAAFAVVITDCRMPGMSGVELTEIIRYEEQVMQRSPCMILGLTADAQREEIQRALAAGMNDCTVKPLGLEALQEKLRSLSRHNAIGQAVAKEVDEPSLAYAVDSAWMMQDFEVLLTLTGGSRENAWRLAREILTSVEQARKQLQPPYGQHDCCRIVELAHQTLGVARMLNHHDLVQACEQVGVACQQHRLDDPKWLESIQQLYSLLAEMSARYRQLFAVNPCL
ncbi:ATP-binding protein [Paenalcaligenes sp. Me131]|uniref:ATP-binding protein n=1 Tax=Paenalcaligenes sp. Me131 TaxID=3392636 RepID=UPI003D281D12